MVSSKHNWAVQVDWIVQDRIAAFSAYALDDLAKLEEFGIGAIVSLTETAPPELTGTDRFEVLWLPIDDMAAPAGEQIERFVEFVDTVLATGKAVGVHCLAGLGRTGTMIACYLVSQGKSAEEAIAQVRRARPGSIQTEQQEQAIRRWAMSKPGESKSRLSEFL